MIRFEILNGMSKNLTGVITLSLAIALLSSSANAERQPNLTRLPEDAGFGSINQDVVQRHDLVIARNPLQENAPIPGGVWNVDPDDHVNIFDLVRVAQKFGEKGANLPEDANGDGEVNTADLELVAQHFGEVYRDGEVIPNSPGAIKRIGYGDLDQKGGVNVFDAILALDASQGKVILSPEQKILADVNGDGEITQTDTELIMAKAGTPDMLFPVERRIMGDLNGDGKRNAIDIGLIKLSLAGLLILDESQELRADTDGDGHLTENDSTLLTLAVVRLLDYLPAEAIIRFGDVNGDGRVSARDSLLIDKAIAGLIELGGVEKVQADVDGDGELTARDAGLVDQRSVGKIDYFPIESPVASANIAQTTGGFDQNDLTVRFTPTTENWVVQVTKVEKQDDGTTSRTTWQGGELRKQGKDVVFYLDDMPEADYVVTVTMLDEFGRQSITTAAFFTVGSKK